MNESTSVTSSALAITEKRPRRSGGCVGIFFQLFDWNRRFAKKKLFSKRLLPPDRAKEASKKFGGDEKLPKLKLIADENSGGFPNLNKNGVSSVQKEGKNGVQTPGLVARLMGLESMPSVHREKHKKDFSGEIRGGKVVVSGDELPPQKLQKTETIERRTVTRFGAEALQLKNVLSRSRKHHHPKLASPVKTTGHHTRRNPSRLIGAATRILEPGLQARSKAKPAITYTIDQASCKNCGSLLDTQKTVFDSDQEQEVDHGVHHVRRVAVSDTKDFVALNRRSSGRTRSRIPAKVEYKRPRIVSSTPAAGKQILRPDSSSDHWRQIDATPFRFSSPMKHRGEVPTKVEKRRNLNGSPCKTKSKTTPRRTYMSNLCDEKFDFRSPFPLTGDSLGALLEEKLKELISAIKIERSNPRNHTGFGPQRNHLPRHNTSFCLQTKPEKGAALFGYKNGDHLSPGSVLEASFSNDSCCSSSLEDSSGPTQHADSLSYSYEESQFQDSETDPFCPNKKNTQNEFASNLLAYISKVLKSIDLLNARLKGNKRSHVKEVIFNTELVLGNQNKSCSFFVTNFLLDELDALAETAWKNFGKFLGVKSLKQEHKLKGFIFDCLIEYLDSKYAAYLKCGFRAWMNGPPLMNSKILIHEVVEEIRRWRGFVGLITDELVERDMSHCLGKWADFEIEVFENGVEIEGGILDMLVDEIVVELMVGIAC